MGMTVHATAVTVRVGLDSGGAHVQSLKARTAASASRSTAVTCARASGRSTLAFDYGQLPMDASSAGPKLAEG